MSSMNTLLFVHMIISLLCLVNCKTKTNVEIGVILDMDTTFGKMSKTCISMAIHDFYREHDNYTTVIRPHFRDSKQDNVEAASAAVELMKNLQVMAIMGPTTSAQADFVIDIGDKSKVPIISPATSPSLSLTDNLYFVRSAHDSTSQLKPIAKVIEYYNWKEVVFVYEDDEYGRGLVPYFSDAMMNISTKVICQTAIHPSASDDWIHAELYKLKTMQTRVFVLHALPELASRFFKKVKETGMMEEGYVWIITEVLTGRLHDMVIMDREAIESMQGVVGVKSHIPRSKELIEFEYRWRREFRKQYLEEDVTELDMFGIWSELDMFGIWSYDAVFALAMAVEEVGNDVNTTFQRVKQDSWELISDLDATGTSEMGPSLIHLIRNTKVKGLSGDFHIVDGQLQPSVYEIVNVIGKGEKSIGFWSPENEISKKLTNQTNDLRAVMWPGDTHTIPKGWESPTNNANILRIGVPAKGRLFQFIDANTDPKTKQVIVTGFCVDVFDAVVGALPYAIKYEYIPFVTPDGKKLAGTYNDLIFNLSDGKYDAVVGDITILANRWDYVDFTLPYTEAGISLIVPIKDERKSAWIFMKPLEKELWIITGAFFIYIGLVIWVIEHRVNKEFRGTRDDQVGMLLWFSFSTLVYAHGVKLISNLSRFVVIVWVFVVLVLTSSYTASLTSMLTVQQLQPSYTNINEILSNGESVGYQKGSYVRDRLKGMNFTDEQLKVYSTFEQYDTALALGSKNGGVSAIMDELPYIRAFLAKYCNYTMTGPVYKTAGFGFAFTKGSTLVHDMSHAILQVTEEQLMNISNQWFGPAASCDQQNGAKVKSDQLRLDSFKGLFLIAGSSSTLAFLIFIFRFLYQNREILLSQDSVSQKIAAIVKTFDVFKDDKSRKSNPEEAVEEVNNYNNSPAVSVFHQEAGMFSYDEGFSATEPGTPVHDTIQALEITPNIP